MQRSDAPPMCKINFTKPGVAKEIGIPKIISNDINAYFSLLKLEVAQLKAINKSHEQKLSSANPNTSLTTLTTKIEYLQKQSDQLIATNELQKAQLSNIAMRNASLMDTINCFKQQVEQFKAEREFDKKKYDKDISLSSKKIEYLEQQYELQVQKLLSSNDSLTKNISHLNQKLLSCTETNTSLTKNISHLNQKVDKYRVEKEKYDEDISSSNKKIEDLNNKYNTKKTEKEALQKKYKQALITKNNLEKEIFVERETNTLNNKEIQNLQKQIKELKDLSASLEKIKPEENKLEITNFGIMFEYQNCEKLTIDCSGISNESNFKADGHV